METVTISMRVAKAEAARLDRVVRAMQVERPAFLRRAIRRGAQDVMFESACEAYRGGRVTLSRAAELAGLDLRGMILRMREVVLAQIEAGGQGRGRRNPRTQTEPRPEGSGCLSIHRPLLA